MEIIEEPGYLNGIPGYISVVADRVEILTGSQFRYGVNKKSTRAKKRRDKALKTLGKHKKKLKKPVHDFSAVHLLHDPQGAKRFSSLRYGCH